MNENFLTVTFFSYSKEMTTGCATFLPVFFPSQIPKLTFAEPIRVLLVFAKDVRRKDRQ